MKKIIPYETLWEKAERLIQGVLSKSETEEFLDDEDFMEKVFKIMKKYPNKKDEVTIMNKISELVMDVYFGVGWNN